MFTILLIITVTHRCVAVWASDSVTAVYGETIEVPCNGGAPAPEDLMFVKWKYVSSTLSTVYEVF